MGSTEQISEPFPACVWGLKASALPFKFQSPPFSRGVTEGFEKKVIVLTAALIRERHTAQALVFHQLSVQQE